MKPRTSAITEIVLFVHWLDAPRPATWQALKPLIEVWIGQPNPDFPKVVGLSYCPGANRQALELLIGRLDDYGIRWELHVTTVVKPAEPGVQPLARRYEIPPYESGNTYVDGGERFVVSMVNGGAARTPGRRGLTGQLAPGRAAAHDRVPRLQRRLPEPLVRLRPGDRCVAPVRTGGQWPDPRPRRGCLLQPLDVRRLA